MKITFSHISKGNTNPFCDAGKVKNEQFIIISVSEVFRTHTDRDNGEKNLPINTANNFEGSGLGLDRWNVE